MAKSKKSNKPECPGCDDDDYPGELIKCPKCGGLKCHLCDMGDDEPCFNCGGIIEDFSDDMTDWKATPHEH